MTKFITVHESDYKHVKEVLVNVDRIETISETKDVPDNYAVIGLSGGEFIYTTETIKEIKELIYGIPTDVVDLTWDSIVKLQEYLNKK